MDGKQILITTGIDQGKPGGDRTVVIEMNIGPVWRNKVPYCSGQACPRWNKPNQCWALTGEDVCKPTIVHLQGKYDRMKRLISQYVKRAEAQDTSAQILTEALFFAQNQVSVLTEELMALKFGR